MPIRFIVSEGGKASRSVGTISGSVRGMTGRGGPRTSREVIEVLAVHHALRRALHVVQIDHRIEVDRTHGLLGHGGLRARNEVVTRYTPHKQNLYRIRVNR